MGSYLNRALVFLAGLAMFAPAALANERPFSWTGLYVGVQGGAIWTKADHSFSFAGAPADNSNAFGGVAGGHIGYNLQGGNVVIGIEADIEQGFVDGKFVNFAGAGSSGASELNWQGSVRARLGLVSGRSLFYLTAGRAFSDFDFKGSDEVAVGCCGYSKRLDAWTFGGGVESAISDRMTVRMEYRYTDFGEARGTLPPGAPAVIMPVDVSTHVVRLGLSGRF
jgi:outer membrane immunogenic protein